MQLIKMSVFALLMGISQMVLAAGATKVAVVDVQQVVLASDAGRQGMKEVEKHPQFAPIKAKFENAEAELKTLDEQLKNEGLTWGEDKKKEHREKMATLAKERQEHMQNLTRMQESAFMQILKALEPRIGMALEQVMQTEGIELIIDSKAAVLKTPTADITAMVVDRLNKINEQAAAEAKKDDKSAKKDSKKK